MMALMLSLMLLAVMVSHEEVQQRCSRKCFMVGTLRQRLRSPVRGQVSSLRDAGYHGRVIASAQLVRIAAAVATASLARLSRTGHARSEDHYY